MTVLTRIEMEPANAVVQRDLGDAGAMHRRTMGAFATGDRGRARHALGVLWRVDWSPGGRLPLLLVQSNEAGEWDGLPAGWARSVAAKRVDQALEAVCQGQTLRFRLRANVTRKIDTKTFDDGVRRRGRRVPVRAEGGALAWLIRHGQAAGFILAGGPGHLSVDLRHEPPALARRPGGVVTIEAIQYDGYLVVTDPASLAQAVRTGIGPGKAFGCGLLSLAPASRA